MGRVRSLASRDSVRTLGRASLVPSSPRSDARLPSARRECAGCPCLTLVRSLLSQVDGELIIEVRRTVEQQEQMRKWTVYPQNR